MHKKSTIMAALLIFVLLVTYPFWSQMGGEKDVLLPVLPTGQTECVESREYMRANHMKMLHDWRDEVVREGKRTYVNSKGMEFNKSLTNTCLKCHSNKEQFCDRCHKTAGVDNYCWDCHHTKPSADVLASPIHPIHGGAGKVLAKPRATAPAGGMHQ